MAPERLLDILNGLDFGDGKIGAQLCARFRAALGVSGVGVARTQLGRHHGSLGSSGESAAAGELAQYSLGEGPGLDASTAGRPVGEQDLAANGMQRWPAFTESALAAGIAAAYAYPLAIGAAEVGALTIYQEHAGPLSSPQTDELLSLTEMITSVLLMTQAEAPPLQLADALADSSAYHPEVHQATGMVSCQLGISLTDAFVRLRAYGYAEGQTLVAVSREVVARRLHLEPS